MTFLQGVTEYFCLKSTIADRFYVFPPFVSGDGCFHACILFAFNIRCEIVMFFFCFFFQREQDPGVRKYVTVMPL